MASLLAGAAATDIDSYLYWMVNVDEGTWNYDYRVQVRGVPGSSEEGPFLNLYYDNGNSAGFSVTREYLQDAKSDPGVGFYAGFASNAGYTSYVIELLSSDTSDLLGRWSWTAAQVETYIAQNGIKAPSLAPLTMSMALPAPEPSSGLLLLLGVAGLALRRRKQIAA